MKDATRLQVGAKEVTRYVLNVYKSCGSISTTNLAGNKVVI
ncbi:hypothetical protein [Staphylococcus equorum]|nr:hypothetical protein [Staphylococcus equorum]